MLKLCFVLTPLHSIPFVRKVWRILLYQHFNAANSITIIVCLFVLFVFVLIWYEHMIGDRKITIKRDTVLLPWKYTQEQHEQRHIQCHVYIRRSNSDITSKMSIITCRFERPKIYFLKESFVVLSNLFLLAVLFFLPFSIIKKIRNY